jgi:NAD(P)-dependent dehydrogenase (short-subunit alcohol dehydrogenase family)
VWPRHGGGIRKSFRPLLFPRWGEPKDLAKAVLFLALDDSSYVNAVELMVDGGLTGAPFAGPILRG